MNSSKSSIPATFNEGARPFVSISTNKYQYLPGETIIISGSVFNKTGPLDSIVSLGVLYSSESAAVYNEKMNPFNGLTYRTDVKTINGSFIFSGFSAQKEGYYFIGAILKGFERPPITEIPFAQVRIVNPLFTIPTWMLVFAMICFIALIFVILLSGRIDFASSEILRFVLISGIVASPIVALLFSDSELGINSPISLILKPASSKEAALDTIWKNQWFIAVGGIKLDNYMSGILIPFYVIVFGLAGGYLRYLYSTSVKLWNLEKSSDATSSNVRIPLFTWNKLPEDQTELQKFKSFLVRSFDADWVNDEGSVIKVENKNLVTTSKGQTKSITIIPIFSDSMAIIKLGDVTYGKLRIEKQNGDLYVYQIIERRVWSFYQSLTDLALLLLSPLLAVAAWFLLTRAGDVDKFIVALVSLTVGLATNSIISYLTDFTTQQIRAQTTSSPTA